MPSYVRLQEIEHEIGPSGRFALRVTSSDVELRATDSGVARVRVQFELRADTEADADLLFESVRYQVVKHAGSLEVVESKRTGASVGSIARIFGIGASARVDATVQAEIPAGAAVTFDGVNGDVNASGFSGTQEYHTVSGDLVLSGVAGGVRIRGTSSDVSLRGVAPMTLELNTVSGDVSAFAPRFDALRLVTVSGDIELEGELASGREHRVETVSGDFRFGVLGGVSLEVRALSSDVRVSLPHRSEGSRDRRRYVIGGGEAQLLFSSMSGDVVAGPARRMAPAPPAPPQPPSPVTPPAPPMAPDAQLAILQALERGEIDVDEAAARLAGSNTDA
jgi:hypothetical protein